MLKNAAPKISETDETVECSEEKIWVKFYTRISKAMPGT